MGYDCNAGYNNWAKGWSDSKKVWCCEHASRGCTTTSPPYDCQAGYFNWVKGWSDSKKSWCCQHRARGCNANEGYGTKAVVHARMALGTPGMTDAFARKFDTAVHPVPVNGNWRTTYLHLSRKATTLMAASAGAVVAATVVARCSWGNCLRNGGYREIDTERGPLTEPSTDAGTVLVE